MPHRKSDSLTLQEITKTVNKYLPGFNSEKFKKAYEFAKDAHEGQFRKDKKPYISHPLETIKILTMLHVDEDTLIAALLHDVPEDTDKTIEEIEEKFGKKTAFLVEGTTKLSKVYYRHDMAERQVESLKKLLIHSAKDPRIILIKLADRLHNMRTLDYVRDDKRLRIAKETMEIYVPIANLFGIKELKNELEDLCFYYLHPAEYQEILKKIQRSNIKLKNLLEKMIALVKKELLKQKIKADIYGRHRSLYALFKKLKVAGRKISDIEDVLALRIIVGTPLQCYKTLGALHTLFKPKPGLFKDYIAVPKPNGYQSLHTTVFGLNGISTEFQIRTRKMHTEAEYGILSRYFSQRRRKIMQLTKDKRSRWVDQVLDIQKVERDSSDFMDDLRRDVFEDRIFVFTPQGDSIDLPKDSTCIDFAYMVHSDVGHKAVKAEINNKPHPLTAILKTGDTVKIITSGGQKGPDRSWLNFVKTNLAKECIRNFLRRESRDEKITAGRKILQKEFDRAGLGLVDDMNFKKVQYAMKAVYKRFFATRYDLLTAVGDGTLKSLAVVNVLLPRKEKFRKWYFFSKKTGKEADRPARVAIRIFCDDRIGFLRDVCAVMSRFALNITKVKAYYSCFFKDMIVKLHFDISSFDKLSELLEHLEQIDGAKLILRVFVRRQVYFLAAAALTMLMWISHPFLIKYVLEPELSSHVLLYSSVLCVGFLMLFVVIATLKDLMQKSFPQFRETQFLWFITFAMIALAVITIAAEMYFLKLYMENWPVILILVVAVSIYFFTEYQGYRKEKRS